MMNFTRKIRNLLHITVGSPFLTSHEAAKRIVAVKVGKTLRSGVAVIIGVEESWKGGETVQCSFISASILPAPFT